MVIFSSDSYQDKWNSHYPHRIEIKTAADLEAAVQYDHVCATYKDNHRSNDDFIESDCLVMDCDNDHSENPADWKQISDIKAAFPGVDFYVVPSRNHMKRKEYNDRVTGEILYHAEKPRYHVYFPIDRVTDYPTYRAIKEAALKVFPWFDQNAKDSARFIYGAKGTIAQFVEGDVE